MEDKEESKKKDKKKPIFKKVGLVFRSPVRADILKELSQQPQRTIDLAENIGLQKQNINYHIQALKKEGLIQTHTEEVNEEEIPKKKGTRINGINERGKLKVSYGVELTKNGEHIVNKFIEPLYESSEPEKKKKMKNKSEQNERKEHSNN